MNKICFITSSRADYGLMMKLMKLVKYDKNLKLQLIVTGSHLSHAHGQTYKEILKDGFKIDHKVKMPISKSTPDNITKATGIGMIGFAKVLKKLKPDLVVVLGDRFEILAAAFAAHSEKIPIAHIGGGESTVGAIDESIRHSVTKMSALHFVTTKESKNRVIQLGENPKNVFLVGSLGVDRMKKLKLYSKKKLESKLKFKLAKNNILITYHPVTLDKGNEKKNIVALIKALNIFKESKIIFTYPNVDSGSDFILKQIKSFTKKNKKNTRLYKSLGDTTYLSLMKYVDLVIGNSSSGIIEAPSFKKIVINIGDRQLDRVKSKRIIELRNKKINSKSLIKYFKIGMSNKFKRKVQKSKNPYETPNSVNKIMKIISNFKRTNGSSIQKQFYNFKKNNEFIK